MTETKIDSTYRSTVLVVEDSPTQAMHVQSLLEEQGVNVVLAADGPEGIALAQRAHPDLVILDMQLPGMHGLEVPVNGSGWILTDKKIILKNSFLLQGF